MRPFVHPAAEAITVETLLHALSDPVRLAIFAAIVDASESQSCSSLQMVAGRSLPKSSLSQHLKLLREAGLIDGERRGVEVLNTSRWTEIEKRFPGLLPAILSAHGRQSRVKGAAGNAARKSGGRTGASRARRARARHK